MNDLARLVVLASLVNIEYFINTYLLASKDSDVEQDEKRILREVGSWANRHTTKIRRVKNPEIAKLYEKLVELIPFTTNMLTISFTVNDVYRNQFIKKCARLSNYYNALSKNRVIEHPDWQSFGDGNSVLDFQEEEIDISLVSKPSNEEMCVIKTQSDGIPIIVYFDSTLDSFIDPYTNVQYYGNAIYKWRSIN